MANQHSTPPGNSPPDTPVVIGRVEEVEFLDWPLPPVRAKVDTGARSSAIDVDNIEELDGDRLRFRVVLNRARTKSVLCEAPRSRQSRVRSSTGHRQRREFVSTRVRIAGVEREIEISLVHRPKMLFRMLLGRRALAGAFLVDVARAAKRPAHRKLPSADQPA